MKKRIALLCLSMACVLSVTACQSKAPAETPDTTDAAGDTASEEQVLTTNYDSTEALSEAAGFMVLELPAYWGDPSAIHMDTNVAAVEYELGDPEHNVLICSAKVPDQDITAGMGIDAGTEEKNGATVHLEQSDDKTYLSAWWSDGILSYSAEALNMDEETFGNMIEELTNITASAPGGVVDTSGAEVANPMVEYETFEEAEAVVGFPGLYLIAASGYDIQNVYVISDNLLDYEYVDRDGSLTLTVRTAKGTEDISGFFGVTYAEQQIAEVAVQVGSLDGSHVAWWTDGTYAFSVSAEEPDEATFLSLVENLVETSKTLN